MNISAHSSILTGIINEFNEFLETVKICECNSTNITEFGQKQEIARECFSKECGDDSICICISFLLPISSHNKGSSARHYALTGETFTYFILLHVIINKRIICLRSLQRSLNLRSTNHFVLRLVLWMQMCGGKLTSEHYFPRVFVFLLSFLNRNCFKNY